MEHYSPQIETILQATSQAAVLLDGEGAVRYANPMAEVLLQSGDGLACENRQLTASVAQEGPALTEWIGERLAGAESRGAGAAPLRIKRPSKKPELVLMPVPLPQPVSPDGEDRDHACLLLLVFDPVSRSTAPSAMVERIFRLTPAEARVAVLIGAGCSAPQAAEALGLSLTTVKTHLGRSFEKIGVNSQVALAKLFAVLPFEPPAAGKA
ncbi:MAG: LuxR C-terminal-related transcriptional regulator [Alphaproteobacteria bacterium]|nr:LuxR C-terminal-related transcriptional regulator [Alphaproteobacteria bacterium]